ncbi:uncharacterized protein LOC129317410 [Prosopis cineraria]|uniref:uncharacterized protein LOC129317410 n=1 Tax=Prosopis cineraria TaxID=364024 RepID=UPI00240F09AD|nr:uncharacterized protein LOC129317410 [Prosopis cineraria]
MKILHDSAIANFLIATNLIIWDEAPMMKKHYFEALDRTLKDIMHCDQIFGGKVIVLGADFQQIFPVIPGASRVDIVNASIHSSYLWYHCKIYKLTMNMRLSASNFESEKVDIQSFSDWLLSIGDGSNSIEGGGQSIIHIPAEFLIFEFIDPLKKIVETICPQLEQNFMHEDFFTSKIILVPTLEVVDQLNNYICSIFSGDAVTYFSSDSIYKVDQHSDYFDDIYNTKFLNIIKCSGMPPHNLTLKVRVHVMLIRNIDQANGLCNGIRLRITLLADHFIRGVTLNGSKSGEEVYIHCMDLNPSEGNLPFLMHRQQFPIVLSFAMTINETQGQTLSKVRVYLLKSVFTHDQLYVALSRVTLKNGLKLLIHDSKFRPLTSTTNVVYKEIFQNVV